MIGGFVVWWQVVLTSAVCSAVVSGLVGFLNAYLDRRSRRSELKFRLAVELAREHVQRRLDMAVASKRSIEVPDSIFVAESYIKCVDQLYKTGKIPDKLWAKFGGRPDEL